MGKVVGIGAVVQLAAFAHQRGVSDPEVIRIAQQRRIKRRVKQSHSIASEADIVLWGPRSLHGQDRSGG